MLTYRSAIHIPPYLPPDFQERTHRIFSLMRENHAEILTDDEIKDLNDAKRSKVLGIHFAHGTKTRGGFSDENH
jgi:hypothetical protein